RPRRAPLVIIWIQWRQERARRRPTGGGARRDCSRRPAAHRIVGHQPALPRPVPEAAVVPAPEREELWTFAWPKFGIGGFHKDWRAVSSQLVKFLFIHHQARFRVLQGLALEVSDLDRF